MKCDRVHENKTHFKIVYKLTRAPKTSLRRGLGKGTQRANHLRKKPLKDISRRLVMYTDCIKGCFYNLEEFYRFGYLS